MKKYKTSSTPEGTYLVQKDSLLAIAPHEVHCYGFYKDGTREPSLDGYYMRGDLIEITDKQEDKYELETAWDFVVKYYPNYDSSDEIAYADDLSKLINNEQQDGDCAHDILMSEFGGDIKNPEIQKEYDRVHREIYEEAINNFIQSQNK